MINDKDQSKNKILWQFIPFIFLKTIYYKNNFFIYEKSKKMIMIINKNGDIPSLIKYDIDDKTN